MLDLSSLLGLLVAAVSLTVGIMLEGDIKFLWIPSAMLFAFGASTGAVIFQFPGKDFSRVLTVAMNAFRYSVHEPQKIITDLVRYAEMARRDGILALESVLDQIEDPFLVKGLQLAVDGTDPELIRQMMTTELEIMEMRHARGRKIFEAWAAYGPPMGMVGTLIGLVAMLRNLSDPSKIGPAMASAMVTTLYGVGSCYLFFTPLFKKLMIRSEDEVHVKEMIIRGVLAIQSGDNPRIVEQKLRIFLEPKERGPARA